MARGSFDSHLSPHAASHIYHVSLLMIGFKQIVWIQSTATGILRIEQLKSFTDFIDRDDHHLKYIFQRFRKKFFLFSSTEENHSLIVL